MVDISGFLVCKIFNLCWDDHYQGTQVKAARCLARETITNLKYSYINKWFQDN